MTDELIKAQKAKEPAGAKEAKELPNAQEANELTEAREAKKQLTTYADAITAFATAQLVAFVFLLAHGDCFTKNILSSLAWTAGVGGFVNLCYLFLVFLCHWGAKKIGPDSSNVAPAMRGVRLLRYIVLCADLTATVLIPFGVNDGRTNKDKQTFFFECKAPDRNSPTIPSN